MSGMSRPRPPHLHKQITRHGKITWYVRRGKGKRIRIRSLLGTDAFESEYAAAISGLPPTKQSKFAHGSLEWLLEQYRQTSVWAELSRATRKQRENIFKHVMATAGREPYTAIRRSEIVAGRDRRKDTPAQARNFLDAMRGLFRWAVDAGYMKSDPTAGVKNPTRKKGEGFPSWTEDEVAKYEERWPTGTKERVWLHVLLYTGLRRGDAVRVGPQHVTDEVIFINTEKSGESVQVALPILPELKRTLKAGPCGTDTFICGLSRKPLTKESFGNMFREACNAAGVKKSAHGLRKIGATRAANNGATVAELEALFGWSGGGMASLYTRKADRVRLAKSAIGKLTRPGSIPPLK